MSKLKWPPLILLALLASCSRPQTTARTWYLEKGDWQPLSEEARNAYTKATHAHQKGKLVRAAQHYEEFLEAADPNSRLYNQVLSRRFSIAKQLLSGRKVTVLGIFKIKGYAHGIRIMDKISDRTGIDDPNGIGLLAAIALAETYEARAKSDSEYYDLAYLKRLEIFETYDRQLNRAAGQSRRRIQQLVKDALLAMARCKHLIYRGADYNAADLAGRAFSRHTPYDSAKGCYEQFRLRYPEDAAKLGIDQKLRQIDEQLAYKDFSIGRYYQRTDSAQAANLYYQMVIRQGPNTEAAELAKDAIATILTTKEQQ